MDAPENAAAENTGPDRPTEPEAPPIVSTGPDGRRRVRGPWMLASLALLVAVLFVTIVVPVGLNAVGTKRAPVDTYQVVAEYPHDAAAFTQGLCIDRGELFESTGLFGKSTLRRVDLASGRVLAQVDLPDDEFGEGICVLGDKIYMLTWRSRKGYIFDRDTLTLLGDWPYRGEGWGLTTDGEWLIMSDGSHKLTFFDPATLKPRQGTSRKPQTVSVKDGPVRIIRYLNELEYINNEVWANVLYKDSLVRISPRNGSIQGFVDLSTLYPGRGDQEKAMNGIAFDRATQKIYVTGKLWPKLYEIRVVGKPRD